LFSWIIADSNLTQLEAVPQESFRDLPLPIEQIRPERRSRFDAIVEASECHSFSGTHFTHFGVVSSFLFLIGLSAVSDTRTRTGVRVSTFAMRRTGKRR
jgi:hypothetical protein